MMAKKSTKKKAPKKGTPRYRNKRTNGHGAKWSGADSRRAAAQSKGRGKPAARAKGPRSQSLPGMSQIRDAKMDEICESIGEGLDGINQSTDQVDEGKSAAMQRLHAKGLSSYRHAGVRVSLIPGADKISVKREKDREINVATVAGETVQSSGEGFTDHEGDGGLEEAEQQ